MTELTEPDTRYPIGKFTKSSVFGNQQRSAAIEHLRSFSGQLEKLLEGISETDWECTYRPGSWNVAQLVHHCADSNANCFIRFKLALTEANPRVTPYDENAWTLQEDYSTANALASVHISNGILQRWCCLMDSMTEKDWQKTFYHPEKDSNLYLDDVLQYYSWHSQHHLKHIEIALGKRNTRI